ncbi:hypothetical protein LINPERPRIM_LOCUS11553 [Linum perenne]
MAAEVSSLITGLNGYKVDDRKPESGSAAAAAALITRDLLGGGSTGIGDGSENNPFQELDLDVQVPTGWEKRLDLKSGKVYLHKSSPSPSSSSDHHHHFHYHHHHLFNNQMFPNLQDLNSPPPPSKITLNLFDESSLELKLTSTTATTSGSPSPHYNQSVCTLDKVKSALERAEKEAPARKRHLMAMSRLSSPSYSTSSDQEEKSGAGVAASPVAAGCPGCLSYVLVMKNNPKCPRCNSVVPMPAMKKPRIDLNMSI